MKIRFTAVVLVLSLLLCGGLCCRAEAALGDVNADGRVNAADALLILRYAVGKADLSEEALQAADTTGGHDPCAKDGFVW